MWIYVYPNRKTNFNSKNGNKKSFSYESKASMSLIPTRRTSLYAQSWEEWRLLSESMFVPIDKWTLTLKRMEGEAFLMKPKPKYHLSQYKE